MTYILYKITFKASLPLRNRLVNLLEEYCMSVAYDDPQTAEDHLLTVEGYQSSTQSLDEVTSQIYASLACHGLAPDLPFTIEILPPTNWLAHNAQTFPPVTIPPFIISTSPLPDLPHGTILIHIHSMMGFGSGEHATTQGCLKALATFEDSPPRSLLDMGCGSGVLSIAATKLFHCPVIAVDVDPLSIQATHENLRTNACGTAIKVRLGDGYNALKKSETFDMITCNIFAGPVCAMAPSLARHLNHGGYGIVSGLLNSQESDVVNAHVAQGLVHKDTYDIGGWSTLVFHKAFYKE